MDPQVWFEQTSELWVFLIGVTFPFFSNYSDAVSSVTFPTTILKVLLCTLCIYFKITVCLFKKPVIHDCDWGGMIVIRLKLLANFSGSHPSHSLINTKKPFSCNLSIPAHQLLAAIHQLSVSGFADLDISYKGILQHVLFFFQFSSS